MDKLEVIARLKVRPGRLDACRAHIDEIMRATRAHDTHTLRCDWFVDEDGTACEVHEMFTDEHGLIEHKLHTMEATAALFGDAAYDHHATIYGTVSPDFVALVTERVGPPTVFAFRQGLAPPARVERGNVAPFEVIARLKVRPGELEGFTKQVAEIVRLTREHDTQTVRYDWFSSADETEYEVHEAYVSEEGLVEHNQHVVEARDTLFADYAFDHRMSVYGAISPHLRDLFEKHAGGVDQFTFVDGLARTVLTTAPAPDS